MFLQDFSWVEWTHSKENLDIFPTRLVLLRLECLEVPGVR
jgi:hypothetical protein